LIIKSVFIPDSSSGQAFIIHNSSLPKLGIMNRFFLNLALFLFALLLPFVAKAVARVAPSDTLFFQENICSGQSFFIGGTVFDAQNLSGTIILPGDSWDGTDSVIVVDLAISPPVTRVINETFCDDQALFINGEIYDKTNPAGTQLLEGAALSGCDSLIVIDLVFLEPANSTVQSVICQGDTVWVNGQAYDQYYYIGMETVTGGTNNGCDSLILVDLTVIPSPRDTIMASYCPYERLVVNGNTYDSSRPTGIEFLKNVVANGCYSTVYVNLSFTMPPTNLQFLGENRVVFLGIETCISIDGAVDNESVTWTPDLPCSDAECREICVDFLQNQLLIATITDENECVFADSILVTISQEKPVYIPNVFNPDAIEPNNRFFIFPGVPVTQVNWFSIYDRWGSLLYEKHNFHTDDFDAAWDGTVNGKVSEPGVYTYAFQIVYFDGVEEVLTGTVTLVR
jgi:hypothetical protein